ncbi:unnamed protein product [Moneuplotes crassus]|uniref:Uncharacterized protein n=1 Tax=Euplotes crassus TaxID=5936 RepID=A0AAD1XJT4_EUPCR|nr:unnamed protein product [Moneuplotes crassus]
MFSETIIEEEEEEETDVHDKDAYRLNLRNKIKSDGRIVKDTEQENMHRWYRDYHSETNKIKVSRGADESEVGDDEEEPPRRNFINLKKAIN